jgi:hypothetical protein
MNLHHRVSAQATVEDAAWFAKTGEKQRRRDALPHEVCGLLRAVKEVSPEFCIDFVAAQIEVVELHPRVRSRRVLNFVLPDIRTVDPRSQDEILAWISSNPSDGMVFPVPVEDMN